MGLHIVKICVEQGYLPYDAPRTAWGCNNEFRRAAASLASNKRRPADGFDEVPLTLHAMGARAVTTF